jgi:hypothetical protein
MVMQASTRRLSALTEAVAWQLRGVVESDALRPLKFGLRDLMQRDEIAARTRWALALPSEPTRFSLDRATGFAVNPFGNKLRLDAVCRLGQGLSRTVERSNPIGGKAFHINRLLPNDVASLETMLAVALHEDVLHTVTSYLGIVPVLGDLDFFCSLPTPSATPFSKSQLYHCDDTSLSQLKFFVYTDDVSERDGPLEVVDATRSQFVRDRVRYRYGGRASRVGDDVMTTYVPEHQQNSFVGPGGTSMIVDTARCFHRGSRIRHSDRRRMVAVFQFVPPHCTQLPLRLRHGAPFAHLATSGMSPLARAVLGEPVDR